MSRQRFSVGFAILSGTALAAAACGDSTANGNGNDASASSSSGSSGSGSGGSSSSGSGGSSSSSSSSGGSSSGSSSSSSGSGGSSSSSSSSSSGSGADSGGAGDGSTCNRSPGYALQFEGQTPDLVQATIAKLPQQKMPRTIELWAYFDGTTSSWVNEHGLFEYGNKNGAPAGGCHEFGINSTAWPASQTLGMLHPYTNCPPGDDFFDLPVGTSKTGWLHVAFGFDGTHYQFTVNGSATLHVGTGAAAQGRVLTPESTWTPAANWSSNATVLSIGTTVDFAGPTGWQGKIDELRVWNVFRTPAEIQANMNVMLRGNEPGLIAYYKFDEGMGTTIADSTGDATNVAAMKSPTLPKWVPSDIPGTFSCAP